MVVNGGDSGVVVMVAVTVMVTVVAVVLVMVMQLLVKAEQALHLVYICLANNTSA